MIIAFIILFIVISELAHMVAVHQQLGISPYPLGGAILCYIIHFIFLIMCIWYCGWIWGIILFLCEFFSIVHSTIGWTLTIPSLFFERPDQMFRLARFEVAMLTPAVLGTFVFCIVSFFVVPFSSLYTTIAKNVSALIVPAILLIVGLIGRIVVNKCLPD